MNYIELNENQKKRIKFICKGEHEIEWEEPKVLQYMQGDLPSIRHSRNDDESIDEELRILRSEFSAYNSMLSNKAEFYDRVSKCIDEIHNKRASWYGVSKYEIKDCLRMHETCLISGEGGIGKSYFVMCLERELTKADIPHLCIYGKFEKETDHIDVEQIINNCKRGFVFIFDAVNEMTEHGQENLYIIVKKLRDVPHIRIVLTYRTNTMKSEILEKYKKIASYELVFPGVSYESALSELQRLSIPDVYMYEDILFTNNALLLKMLCRVLSSPKIKNEIVNSVNSVTYIMESYIKITTDKETWENTKRVAKWMYDNESKRIDIDSLSSIIKNSDIFVSKMVQSGFGEIVDYRDETFFHFLIDSLSDYLIARSLFDEIDNTDNEDLVRTIKSKVEKLYGIEEAVILVIFDKYQPDYERIGDILKSTQLIDFLRMETLVKIHFDSNNTSLFQSVFKCRDEERCLSIMGGYADKPFNCCNKLFEYYHSLWNGAAELSRHLAGYYTQHTVKLRLRNLLYFIVMSPQKDRRDEEAFYFAYLCCASSNKDIRCLATKLLYEIASKNEKFIKNMINHYDDIDDCYIKESIVYVLSCVKRSDQDIRSFFRCLIINEKNLTAKSIARIAKFLNAPYEYIRWNRQNLYRYNEKATISDHLSRLFIMVDLYNKDYLPFRFWSKDKIDLHTFFLATEKNDVERINEYLDNTYSCVNGGECSGWMALEKKLMPEISKISYVKELDRNSFFESYEKVINNVFEYYEISADKMPLSNRELDFIHSTYMKCVDIATGLYYGSLMCNYYTNQFASYNSDQNCIGYEVYNPIEYGEKISITSPIPLYYETVEEFGDIIINKIDDSSIIHDIRWERDIDLTRSNLRKIIAPFIYHGEEWVLLTGVITLQNGNSGNPAWKDHYYVYCCTSDNETIENDGNAGHLTIDIDEYEGTLKDYSFTADKPWLCKRVNCINNQSEVFEQTLLVLPPADIIRFFNLKPNEIGMTWESDNKTDVIICNNNKHSYYRDAINSTVYIRSDYLEKFVEVNTLKYFAFAERFIPETGYDYETSVHFEITDGNISKEIKNYGNVIKKNDSVRKDCLNCTKAVNFRNMDSDHIDLERFKRALEKYGG